MSPVWHALALVLQSTTSSSEQVDFNTLLLGILIAIAGWTLHGVHRLTVSSGRVEERVWGSDGAGGHEGEIRKLKADLDALRGAVSDIQAVLRMKQRLNAVLVPVGEEVSD